MPTTSQRGFTWARPTATPFGPIGPNHGVGTAFPGADRFLLVLGLILTGYALFGRGFAYLGVPPLFVGEVVLGAGVLLWVTGRSVGRTVSLAPMMVLLAALAWVTVRTLPNIGHYGVDAPRDAMIVGYGIYAFIVAGFLIEKPERLKTLLNRYVTFAAIVVAVGWVVYLTVRQAPDLFPHWPWAPNTRIIENKPGDLLVHYAGVTALLVLGHRRTTPWIVILLLLGVAVGMIGNRGGMLGYFLAIGVFVLLKPPTAKFGRLLYAIVLFAVLSSVLDTTGIQTNEGSRTLSVEQIVENVKSIFGRSDAEALNATVDWRIEWWTEIADYTFDGPYFWTGKGFGINLANEDGFSVSDERYLRSPHNATMTMLARGGVPGLLLWLAVHLTYLAVVLRAWAEARRSQRHTWMGIFAFVLVYWVVGIVNSSFDVYLEGPMGAIWFWTMFGIGVGSVYVFRRDPGFWDEDSSPSVETSSVPAWSWFEARQTPASAESVAP